MLITISTVWSLEALISKALLETIIMQVEVNDMAGVA